MPQSHCCSKDQVSGGRHQICVLYSIEKLDVERVVVYANDTDILVLLLYYWQKYVFQNFELCLHTTSNEYIAVHDMANSLGEKCQVLPYMHAFTRSDVTIYMYGVRRGKVFKAISKVLSTMHLLHNGERPTWFLCLKYVSLKHNTYW